MSQNNDRGYFRHGEHRFEVGTVIERGVRGQKEGRWSGVGFVSVGFGKDVQEGRSR